MTLRHQIYDVRAERVIFAKTESAGIWLFIIVICNGFERFTMRSRREDARRRPVAADGGAVAGLAPRPGPPVGTYRGKMIADQLAVLEKRYLARNLLEAAGLPRLSLLFYMR